MLMLLSGNAISSLIHESTTYLQIPQFDSLTIGVPFPPLPRKRTRGGPGEKPKPVQHIPLGTSTALIARLLCPICPGAGTHHAARASRFPPLTWLSLSAWECCCMKTTINGGESYEYFVLYGFGEIPFIRESPRSKLVSRKTARTISRLRKCDESTSLKTAKKCVCRRHTSLCTHHPSPLLIQAHTCCSYRLFRLKPALPAPLSVGLINCDFMVD